MEKGCYHEFIYEYDITGKVTIHSDSGKGLLQKVGEQVSHQIQVTIHSDSGKGLLRQK